MGASKLLWTIICYFTCFVTVLQGHKMVPLLVVNKKNWYITLPGNAGQKTTGCTLITLQLVRQSGARRDRFLSAILLKPKAEKAVAPSHRHTHTHPAEQ